MNAPTPEADWHLLVPGSIDQRTGGYLYDARITRALQAAGRPIRVHELDGRFPLPDAQAAHTLDAVLGAIPSGAWVIVDGLAMGAQPGVVEPHGKRLRLIALIHHLLADETGLRPDVRDRLLAAEQRVLAACRGCIVTSAHTGRRLEALGVPARRVRVVVPGTDPGTVGATARRPGGAPLMLCVGTLTPRKGQHVLVEALSALRAQSWQCRLVGSTRRDPAYAGHIRAMIREQGLEQRILLTGEVGDDALADHYADADLFVLPSFHEGYGMVLTEALARGLPVVATTAGAIPDTVPASAAILTPPGEAGALADALQRCLDSPDLRERLGRAALAHARSLPDWPACARAFARAVEELT